MTSRASFTLKFLFIFFFYNLQGGKQLRTHKNIKTVYVDTTVSSINKANSTFTRMFISQESDYECGLVEDPSRVSDSELLKRDFTQLKDTPRNLSVQAYQALFQHKTVV